MTGPSSSPVRLHVVTGKGGTGKTTVATAMALALASRGQRVLLAEVEGRQGLSQVLDVAPLGTEERPLVTDPSGGEVVGLSVDAKAALMRDLADATGTSVVEPQERSRRGRDGNNESDGYDEERGGRRRRGRSARGRSGVLSGLAGSLRGFASGVRRGISRSAWIAFKVSEALDAEEA